MPCHVFKELQDCPCSTNIGITGNSLPGAEGGAVLRVVRWLLLMGHKSHVRNAPVLPWRCPEGIRAVQRPWGPQSWPHRRGGTVRGTRERRGLGWAGPGGVVVIPLPLPQGERGDSVEGASVEGARGPRLLTSPASAGLQSALPEQARRLFSFRWKSPGCFKTTVSAVCH